MKGGANPLNFIEFKKKIISENPVYRQTDEWWEYLEQDLSYYASDEEQRRVRENTRGIVNTVTPQGTNLMVPPEGFDNLDLLFVLGTIISKSYIERKMETMQQDSLLNVKSVNRFSIGLNSTPRQFVEFVESLIVSLKGIKEFGFWMNASRNEELKEIINSWYSGSLNNMSKDLRQMFYLWPQSLIIVILNLEEFVDVAYTDVFPDSRQATLAKRLRANPTVLEPLDEQLVTVNDDILNQEYARLLSNIEDELEIYNSDKSSIHGQKKYLEEIRKDIIGHTMNYEKILDKYKAYRARGDDDRDIQGFLYNLTKDYYKFINNILDQILYDTIYHRLTYNYNMDKSIQRGYYMMLILLIKFRTLLTDVEWEHRARVVLKNVLDAIETRIRWIQRFLQPAPGNIPRTAMPLLGQNLSEYEIKPESQLSRQDSRSTVNKLKQIILDNDEFLEIFKKKLERLNVVRASVEEMQKNQIGDDVTNPEYEYDFDELSVLPKSELIKIIQEDDYYHNLDILVGDPIGPDPSIEDIADYLVSLKDDMEDNQYGPGEDYDLEKIKGNKKNLGLILIIEATINDLQDIVGSQEELPSIDMESVRKAKYTLQMMARRRRSRFQKPNGIFWKILDNTIESIKEFETSKTISINLLQRFEQHFREGLPTNSLQREYEMYIQNHFENLTQEQLEELQKLDEEERYMYETQSTAVPGKPSLTVERRLYDRFNKQNEGQQLNIDRTYNPQVAQKMRELERQRRDPSKTQRQLRWLEREGVNIKTPFDNKKRFNRYLTLKNKPVNPRLSAINRQIQFRQQPRAIDSRRLAQRIDDERRYRSNPDYFGELIDFTGDEGYQMSRMFDDGFGFDIIPEEPINVSDNSDTSSASTISEMRQPVNRQLNFEGGKKIKKIKSNKKTKKK